MKMNLAEETFVNQLDAYEGLQKLQFSEVPRVDEQVLTDVITGLCVLFRYPLTDDFFCQGATLCAFRNSQG